MIAAAERLGIVSVANWTAATSVVRPAHVAGFELVP